MTTVLVIMPIWTGIFYWKNRKKWEDEDWDEKWGAPLEGLEKEPLKPMTESEMEALGPEALSKIHEKAQQADSKKSGDSTVKVSDAVDAGEENSSKEDVEEEAKETAIVRELTSVDTNRRNWTIFFPISFMARRVIFALSVVVFPEQIFLQLACAFSAAVTMITYLGHKWPFDSPFSTKMEIFNECTNILLLYHMMMFTDWVS